MSRNWLLESKKQKLYAARNGRLGRQVGTSLNYKLTLVKLIVINKESKSKRVLAIFNFLNSLIKTSIIKFECFHGHFISIYRFLIFFSKRIVSYSKLLDRFCWLLAFCFRQKIRTSCTKSSHYGKKTHYLDSPLNTQTNDRFRAYQDHRPEDFDESYPDNPDLSWKQFIDIHYEEIELNSDREL